MASKGYRNINIPAELFEKIQAEKDARGLNWPDYLDACYLAQMRATGPHGGSKPAASTQGPTEEPGPEGDAADDGLIAVEMESPLGVGDMDPEDLADLVVARVKALLPSPEALAALQAAVEEQGRRLYSAEASLRELVQGQAGLGYGVAQVEKALEILDTRMVEHDIQEAAWWRKFWFFLFPSKDQKVLLVRKA